MKGSLDFIGKPGRRQLLGAVRVQISNLIADIILG